MIDVLRRMAENLERVDHDADGSRTFSKPIASETTPTARETTPGYSSRMSRLGRVAPRPADDKKNPAGKRIAAREPPDDNDKVSFKWTSKGSRRPPRLSV